MATSRDSRLLLVPIWKFGTYLELFLHRDILATPKGKSPTPKRQEFRIKIVIKMSHIFTLKQQHFLKLEASLALGSPLMFPGNTGFLNVFILATQTDYIDRRQEPQRPIRSQENLPFCHKVVIFMFLHTTC